MGRLKRRLSPSTLPGLTVLGTHCARACVSCESAAMAAIHASWSENDPSHLEGRGDAAREESEAFLLLHISRTYKGVDSGSAIADTILSVFSH